MPPVNVITIIIRRRLTRTTFPRNAADSVVPSSAFLLPIVDRQAAAADSRISSPLCGERRRDNNCCTDARGPSFTPFYNRRPFSRHPRRPPATYLRHTPCPVSRAPPPPPRRAYCTLRYALARHKNVFDLIFFSFFFFILTSLYGVEQKSSEM